MSKLPIAGGTKFIPTSEPNERLSVGTIPKAGKVLPDTTWEPDEGLIDNKDHRPHQAIPAEGQETHDGFSGFIPEEKFSNQGSLPYKQK
jgi:hypothetical protein